MYLVAVLLPPVAVLICGKPIQVLINLLLCLLLIIPGIIHAIFVVREYKADKRLKQLTIANVSDLPDWIEGPEKKSDAPVYIILAIVAAVALIIAAVIS